MKPMAFSDGKDIGELAKVLLKPVAALILVVLSARISIHQKLGIEKDMAWSIARSYIQLAVVGFVLHFIFARKNIVWILLVYFFMVIVAGYTAGQRAKGVPHGKYVAGASILLGTSVTMFLLVLLRVFPFTPLYMIPVAGMMVGNAMTATGLTLKCLGDDIRMNKDLVETALALGATPRQATERQVRTALVVSLARSLDNAKTVGLISLPGIAAGLLMGGASPIGAIHLQMVMIYIFLGASSLSSIASTYICQPYFFTETYQLQSSYFNE